MTPGHYSFTFFVLPLVATAAITAGLGLYALLKRRIAGASTFAVVMFEAMGDGVLVLDGARRIVDINPAASQVLGLSSAATIGRPLEQVLPDLSDLEQERTELAIDHAEGARRYDVQLSPVQQRDGQLAGYLVVLRDVSALRLSQERFRAHFHNSPLPTYAWKRQADSFVLVDFNAAAEAMTDNRINSMLGLRADKTYADRQDILDDLRTCLNEHRQIRREMHYRFPNGERLLDVTYVFVPPDLVTSTPRTSPSAIAPRPC